MRVSKRAGAVALGVTFALVATGCGSGAGEDDTGGSTASGAITIDGSQPQHTLIPSNTTEAGGGNIVDFLWTGLVSYPSDGGDPVNAMAESIETGDSKVYTIKVKKGHKFHDGTDVKAKNFVDAWNWAAYGPSGAANGTFFDKIDGYKDVHTEDPDGPDKPGRAPKPPVDKMKGLEIVDEYTFKVTLSAPFSIFPTMLGYSAFMPLPDVFFANFAENSDAFGKNPIGNGPVKFVSWQDDEAIKLTRFDDYQLTDKVKIKDVTVKLYQDSQTAYNDLISGNLDFQQQVPTSALAGGKWKTDLADRTIDVPIPSTAKIDFPFYDDRFKDVRIRRAISLAVDRKQITDKVFDGSKKPADSWANPLTPGAVDGNCSACQFDAQKAKELLQQAGGWSGGPLDLYYNANGPHKEWMEAVAQQIKNNLGIDAKAVPVPTFAQFRDAIDNRKMKGMYRAAWQQDYPDVENWIGPLYVTGGSSNDGQYSNSRVDALYREGVGSANLDDAHKKFAEAVKIVDEEVPSVVVFFYAQQSGYSEKIKKVQTSAKGPIDLSSVELA